MMDGCDNCDGACCRRYFVPVSDSDVRRLAASDLSPLEYVDFCDVAKIESEQQDIRLDDGYYYMVLKRREDGACVFSRQNNGVLRCSVHGYHPMLCRIYPFNPVNAQLRDKYSCAAPPKIFKDLQETAVQAAVEHGFYSRKVRIWNQMRRETRTREEFIRYVLRVCSLPPVQI
ncbi:Putative zinc- or iron-chelating domain protein [uncultured archaeon]|nr:Putative zinc- or iron-chelating domain protein [uncultured archaeon]